MQRDLVRSLTEHLDGVRRLEHAIATAQVDVAIISAAILDLDERAAAEGFAIGPDGAVSDVTAPPVFEHPSAASAYFSLRIRHQQAIADRVAVVIEKAVEVDTFLFRSFPSDSFSAMADKGVAPRVAHDWGVLTDAERTAMLDEMAEDLAGRYGVETPEIRIRDFDTTDFDGDGVPGEMKDAAGFWKEEEGVAYVDSAGLSQPQVISTVAHEVRHASQVEAIRDADPGLLVEALVEAGIVADPFDPPPGADAEDVAAWKDNYANFQGLGTVDLDVYTAQPVEVDASVAGSEFLDSLTDLDDYRAG